MSKIHYLPDILECEPLTDSDMLVILHSWYSGHHQEQIKKFRAMTAELEQLKAENMELKKMIHNFLKDSEQDSLTQK